MTLPPATLYPHTTETQEEFPSTIGTSDPTKKTKICRICKFPLPFTEFTKEKKSRDGYASRCRGCTKKHVDNLNAQRICPPLDTEKACARCGAIKPLRDFSRNNTGRDGRKTIRNRWPIRLMSTIGLNLRRAGLWQAVGFRVVPDRPGVRRPPLTGPSWTTCTPCQGPSKDADMSWFENDNERQARCNIPLNR